VPLRSVSYIRAREVRHGMEQDKVTHENVHEKLDSIEIERYTYLSDPTHLTRPKYAGNVRLQSPLISALSDVVV
jgi:hypothetical protein